MARPELSRVPEWYHRYVNAVEESDLHEAIRNQTASFTRFLETLPVNKRDYRYAADKWTIKEMLQHIIDGERVFAYRSLCFARKDATPLPGFDENEYAANAKADSRDWNELVEEFKSVRRSTEFLFASFDNEQLESAGVASGKPVYVLGIGFVIVGHINHHVKVIEERYLNATTTTP